MKNEKSLNFVRILILCAVAQQRCRCDLEFVIAIAADGGQIFNLVRKKTVCTVQFFNLLKKLLKVEYIFRSYIPSELLTKFSPYLVVLLLIDQNLSPVLFTDNDFLFV